MVSIFTIYDLTFLVVFTLGVILFLYTHKKNLQRQGLLYLYRTKIGINFIDKFTKKFEKVLYPLQYIIVFSGFTLMFSMLWLLIKFSWSYITSPVIAQAIKIPVVIPLIPYLPEIFKIDFLPSFNFTYWIIVIAIIAIPHEFAHGIFARLNKVKVHSTGFGFLGPFLAAFVEPDEKQMEKLKKFPQMAILASGTFANIIFTIFFGIIMWLFFISAFVPAGVIFNAYATSVIDVSSINSINGINIVSSDQIAPALNNNISKIISNNSTYFVPSNSLKLAVENSVPRINVFDDSPAYEANLEGAITEINGGKITSYNQLHSVIVSHSSGDVLHIKTAYQKTVRENEVELKEYDIKLSERNGVAFLGIGRYESSRSGLLGSVYSVISSVKDPFTYYESSLGVFGWFIYYLLWWTVLISLSVALVNMLPVGIFDGGKFFYLAVWGVTGSENIAKKAFKVSTWFILALIAALMVKWLLLFV